MILFILLLFGHWLADFTQLSKPYMQDAKKLGRPLKPIFHYALVHTSLVMLTLVCFAADPFRILLACLMMLVSHFVIDVWKGKMNVWFPALQDPVNVFHWWVFGLDQMMHVIVLFLIYNLFSFLRIAPIVLFAGAFRKIPESWRKECIEDEGERETLTIHFNCPEQTHSIPLYREKIL